MKILVTGGSGFLGGYVLREARSRGHHCVALARSQHAATVVARTGARPLTGDLDDADGLAAMFTGAHCDVLVNLASLGFGHAPAIVAAAEQAAVAHAVFVSTTAVTTRLPAASRQVRLDAEERIRGCSLSWTILRPTMIYGAAGDRNLSRLLPVLGRTPVLLVPGGGARLQQPVHVADLAAAVLSAAERPAATFRTYNVAGPEPLTFAELLRLCAVAVASTTRFVPVPLAPAVAVIRCYERVSRRPRIRAEQLLRLAEDKAFSISSAIKDLGYAPQTFADGIAAEARALGLAA